MSLIEVVVSVLISSLIILVATQLYHVVSAVNAKALYTAQDLSRQAFIRDQVQNLDLALTVQTRAFEGQADRLRFISRNSARHGKQGQPVLVQYTANEVLYYDEQAADADKTVPMHEIFWKKDAIRFSYWDSKDNQWMSVWPYAHRVPPLIRLPYAQIGETVEIIMATQGLSLFLSSGSSRP